MKALPPRYKQKAAASLKTLKMECDDENKENIDCLLSNPKRLNIFKKSNISFSNQYDNNQMIHQPSKQHPNISFKTNNFLQIIHKKSVSKSRKCSLVKRQSNKKDDNFNFYNNNSNLLNYNCFNENLIKRKKNTISLINYTTNIPKSNISNNLTNNITNNHNFTNSNIILNNLANDYLNNKNINKSTINQCHKLKNTNNLGGILQPKKSFKTLKSIHSKIKTESNLTSLENYLNKNNNKFSFLTAKMKYASSKQINNNCSSNSNMNTLATNNYSSNNNLINNSNSTKNTNSNLKFIQKYESNLLIQTESNTICYNPVLSNNYINNNDKNTEKNLSKKNNYKENDIKMINLNINNNINYNFCDNLENEIYKNIKDLLFSNFKIENLSLCNDLLDISNQNIQIVSEYISDIYSNLLLEERQIKYKSNYGYMLNQTEINDQMRSILIDWLIDVHLKYHFKEETLYLTINLIDIYLSNNFIKREDLQLLGVSSIFIACKSEEIYVPKLNEFVYITDNAYSKENILAMEYNILRLMHFNIILPSPLRFFEILSLTLNFNKVQFLFGRFLMESFMLDYKSTKFSASIISCACAYIVMKRFNLSNYQVCYNNLIFNFKELLDTNSNNNPYLGTVIIKECAKDIFCFLDFLNKGNLKATQKKYSSESLLNVTKYLYE